MEDPDTLIGTRCGRWVVLGISDQSIQRHRAYLCRCDCGNTKLVRKDKLEAGTSRSCGCLRTYVVRPEFDLTGRRFGRLLVVGLTGKRERRHRVWLCQCDCGGRKEVPTGRLRLGLTRSCGCLLIENKRKAPQDRSPVANELVLELSSFLQEFAKRNHLCRSDTYALLRTLLHRLRRADPGNREERG